ncbi:hypothetical protein F2Q70_00042599 [Brassica cretica]|uniref:Uncharacterized protein n=1 Tax=Brassica cretica TaxID=69181 RepID=A0A8S9KES0_BRACR|nr:hypothetical protein F2Q70_00042599 [Brassica cretica]
MNYVVEMYDTALKETISKLKQADKLVRVKYTVLNRRTSEFKATIDKAVAEQSRLLAEKKAQKEKFVEKFGELKGKDLEGSSVQGRGNVSGIERTEDASEPTTASVALSPAPVAVNLVIFRVQSCPIPSVVESGGFSTPSMLSCSLAEDSSRSSSAPFGLLAGTGGASDPLGAQVIGGDLDRAED